MRTAKRPRPSSSKSLIPSRKVKYATGSALAPINLSKAGDSIGVHYETHLGAVKLIEVGLPFSAIARFQNTTGLTLERIKSISHISEGSYSRRRETGRLSPDESERLLRISRIFESAVALHDGDQCAAILWLETPIPALSDERPLDLARTEPGAREVEDLIGRIAHGVVS